jgi:hypothetical protein
LDRVTQDVLPDHCNSNNGRQKKNAIQQQAELATFPNQIGDHKECQVIREDPGRVCGSIKVHGRLHDRDESREKRRPVEDKERSVEWRPQDPELRNRQPSYGNPPQRSQQQDI